MYNVVTKIGVLLIVFGAMACGSQSKEDLAELMFEQSKEKYISGDYEQALQILDSIDSVCVEIIDVRREVTKFRPQVMEKCLEKQLIQIDKKLDSISVIGLSARELMVDATNPVERYYVAKVTGNEDVRRIPGLHARVSPQFTFYVTSSSDRKVKSTSVGLSSGVGNVRTSEVNYDGERNDRSGRCETITFTESECDTLGHFVMNHEAEPLILTFYGESTYSIPLSSKQKQAIVDAYSWVKAIRVSKQLVLQKDRLQRQLEVARSQNKRLNQIAE